VCVCGGGGGSFTGTTGMGGPMGRWPVGGPHGSAMHSHARELWSEAPGLPPTHRRSAGRARDVPTGVRPCGAFVNGRELVWGVGCRTRFHFIGRELLWLRCRQTPPVSRCPPFALPRAAAAPAAQRRTPGAALAQPSGPSMRRFQGRGQKRWSTKPASAAAAAAAAQARRKQSPSAGRRAAGPAVPGAPPTRAQRSGPAPTARPCSRPTWLRRPWWAWQRAWRCLRPLRWRQPSCPSCRWTPRPTCRAPSSRAGRWGPPGGDGAWIQGEGWDGPPVAISARGTPRGAAQRTKDSVATPTYLHPIGLVGARTKDPHPRAVGLVGGRHRAYGPQTPCAEPRRAGLGRAGVLVGLGPRERDGRGLAVSARSTPSWSSGLGGGDPLGGMALGSRERDGTGRPSR
jgi:hypothetical protein